MRTRYLCALAIALGACATAPKTKSGQDALATSAEATLQTMQARDPGLSAVLADAAGYAVFPEIGKGGVIVGAAYGRGVLYEHGKPAGFVELNQGSVGAQLGAQTFSELLVLSDPSAVARLKAGQFSVGGNVSAVALTAGAAASAYYRDGVAVFVLPRGGVMAELSVSGQRINFQPLGG